MAFDPLFESAWLKWGQAMHHARALQVDIDAAPAVTGEVDPLVAVTTDYHPRRHGFSLNAAEVLATPVQWGLLLGDVANNYRCALDHLAWALVTRGATPPAALTPQQQGVIYFPIAEGRPQFNRDRPRKLPGVRRGDVAKIRRQQPYHYARRNRVRHSLLILSRLNNRDKHRSIEPVWAQPTQLDIEITARHDCVLPRATRFVRTPEPLRAGAELAFIRVRKTGPSPSLEVATRCAVLPSIENRIAVKEWVVQTGAMIGTLLGEFSDPPQDVADAASWIIA